MLSLIIIPLQYPYLGTILRLRRRTFLGHKRSELDWFFLTVLEPPLSKVRLIYSFLFQIYLRSNGNICSAM